jgi:hypothetical protein
VLERRHCAALFAAKQRQTVAAFVACFCKLRVISKSKDFGRKIAVNLPRC